MIDQTELAARARRMFANWLNIQLWTPSQGKVQRAIENIGEALAMNASECEQVIELLTKQWRAKCHATKSTS